MGAPVVFVHGTLRDLREWSGQDNGFAQTHRVLVYSRRYHPPNPQIDDAQPYSLKLHVEDLAALLLTLDFAPAHVVGSSYGAYTALELAREHPELVRSLVLADAPIFPLLSHGEVSDSLGSAFYNNALDPIMTPSAEGEADSTTCRRQRWPICWLMRSRCGAKCSPTGAITLRPSRAPSSAM